MGSCARAPTLCRADDAREVLRRMRTNEQTCDVIFVVGGCRFPAHRSVLSLASPMLDSMLCGCMKESKELEVVLPKFKPLVWQTTLDFIYFNSVTVIDVLFGLELYECASFYQLNSMEDAIVDTLEPMIDESNCCEVMVIAERLGCRKLKTKSLEVAALNFSNLNALNTFIKLNANLMEELVASRSLIVRGEADVLEAIIKWLIGNGHCVNESMLERYAGECGGAELLKIRDSSVHPPTDNVIEKLTHHLILDRANQFDLTAMVRLSREAKLEKLASSCNELMLNESRLRFAPPISLQSRCTHPRNCPTFIFYSRIYGVNSRRTGVRNYTSWEVDNVGKWRWRFEWWIDASSEGKFFNGRLEMKWKSADCQDRFKFQAFAYNSKNTSKGTMNWLHEQVFEFYNFKGCRFRAELNEMQPYFDKDTDSTTLGAIIYITALKPASLLSVTTIVEEKEFSFIYVLRDYRNIEHPKIYSVFRYFGGFKWRLLVFPRGNQTRTDLSVYLECGGPITGIQNESNSWRRPAHFHIQLVHPSRWEAAGVILSSLYDNAPREPNANADPSTTLESDNKPTPVDIIRDCAHAFRENEPDWGYCEFVPFGQLRPDRFCDDGFNVVIKVRVRLLDSFEMND